MHSSRRSPEPLSPADKPVVILMLGLVISCIAMMYFAVTGDNGKAEVVEYRVTGDLQIFNVTATTYQPVEGQTDSTPGITADGTMLNLEDASWADERIIAMSRDMLEKFGGPISWGEKVWVELPGSELSGWWTVHDTMSSRFKNRVDLMVLPENNNRWDNVVVVRPVVMGE